jgi:hypothetical protein
VSLLLSIWGLLARIPREVWLIAAALAALWLWGNHREAQGRYEGRAEIQAQWDKAKVEAERRRKSEEARQANLSKGADRAVIENTASERDRTEQFIARGGVRQGRCPRIPAPVSGAGDSAPVREAPLVDDAEALPAVAVTPDDVRICTENTVKAEAWRDLLLKLESGENR